MDVHCSFFICKLIVVVEKEKPVAERKFDLELCETSGSSASKYSHQAFVVKVF